MHATSHLALRPCARRSLQSYPAAPGAPRAERCGQPVRAELPSALQPMPRGNSRIRSRTLPVRGIRRRAPSHRRVSREPRRMLRYLPALSIVVPHGHFVDTREKVPRFHAPRSERAIPNRMPAPCESLCASAGWRTRTTPPGKHQVHEAVGGRVAGLVLLLAPHGSSSRADSIARVAGPQAGSRGPPSWIPQPPTGLRTFLSSFSHSRAPSRAKRRQSKVPGQLAPTSPDRSRREPKNSGSIRYRVSDGSRKVTAR